MSSEVRRFAAVDSMTIWIRPVWRGRLEAVPLADVLSVQRWGASGRSFGIHRKACSEPTRVVVRRSTSRIWESELRRAHVRIVDEYGAMIDDSQFEKEADPKFAKGRDPDDPDGWDLLKALTIPNFILRWRFVRALRRANLRQSYDDAEGE
jgi:hypothetical protein